MKLTKTQKDLIIKALALQSAHGRHFMPTDKIKSVADRIACIGYYRSYGQALNDTSRQLIAEFGTNFGLTNWGVIKYKGEILCQ